MAQVIVGKDYDDMSRRAASIVAEQIKEDPACVLGLATGSTPIGLYDELISLNKSGEISFKDITTYNLDEYCSLDEANDQSYRYFMNDHLFDHVDIDKANTHVPCGIDADADTCVAYDCAIEDAGGIDLQVLGLGHNGHIGFNEPAEEFVYGTNIVKLKPSTVEANSRFFASADEVPTEAITMGIGTIFGAKKILVVVSGKDKAKIVNEVVNGPITPHVPASVLRFHPNVVFVIDEDAASMLDRS